MVPQGELNVVVAHPPPSGKCFNISLHVLWSPSPTENNIQSQSGVREAREDPLVEDLHVPEKVPHFINDLGDHLPIRHLPGVTLQPD